ncbi:hypothetical protein FE782_20110 [Paenibacillus antri]|uniref:Uncharacterized protein n=1 Tax=Paenibacillus antri TaxID=2582848 RepID=A0A5R9GG01_9BACL|nr:hypothetical protein [Paenibacillus antri]TLS50335.1 hypothetical protein FE782_20110 [Paenibacillus antri]
MHKHEAIEICKQHMHKYVLIHTTDGMQYDGIVESMDDEYVYLAVPVGSTELMPPQARALPGYYGYGPGYGYGYPGYYPGYGYGYPGYGYGGRFRRLALPLAALAAISLLPYF